MRKYKLFLLLIIAIFIIATPVLRVNADEECKGIILIDPGHGGADGGAKSKNGTIEKDINLEISKRLKERLEKDGYKVHMTREDDTALDSKKVADLTKRCEMKKETNCDVFISIHQNKFNSEKCFGAQVWYADNEKSNIVADFLQDSLKEKTEDNNKRVAKAAKKQYKILRDGYDGACVIVECGFLSNSSEEQRLKTEEHQLKIVEGITCGVNKYFEEKR
ncbi:MAG: N-acetylmuramoyl-L-alanine amidase CwlD [Clostridium sp.]|uniref:N-acetylmuramoyl-L-alanine amidase CwlD n=1 Tax=Clostridium sp. DSM 8431 TaxID=1761781 RepID=UPI0008DF5542|nr:N-acetylmuramoyl-L-alanine amidase CwlD [Clostridium sp. DSM 8431]MCR4944883.1 N-acetylmuramoyl-L-alanine amidase CwlD [Clostridium sp.]SFU30109.1 N-acetylmuramoyl-L-alanine amidase [Clostridium sp. DSM 8431]